METEIDTSRVAKEDTLAAPGTLFVTPMFTPDRLSDPVFGRRLIVGPVRATRPGGVSRCGGMK
jgi:hypothetical protein